MPRYFPNRAVCNSQSLRTVRYPEFLGRGGREGVCAEAERKVGGPWPDILARARACVQGVCPIYVCVCIGWTLGSISEWLSVISTTGEKGVCRRKSAVLRDGGCLFFVRWFVPSLRRDGNAGPPPAGAGDVPPAGSTWPGGRRSGHLWRELVS